MPSGYDVYEPQDVLQPIGDEIWIVEGPILRWGYAFWKLPFPTRMTIIRLSDGGLWIHSPIKPDETLIPQIKALGEVRHLVSPNAIHHVSLKPWSERFTKAKVWASPGVRKRSHVHFTDDLADTPPPDWSKDIDQRIAYGSAVLEEVVFFHKKSETLILTDLIENYELKRTHGWINRLLIIIGRVHKARPPIDFQLSFIGGKRQFRPVVEWMLACKPNQIVIAHGKWIRTAATQAIKNAFSWALK